MLVAGYSGIGKTSLIQELYKPIVRQRGYFLSGKFDLVARSVPFGTLETSKDLPSNKALPLLARARRSPSVWRELPLAFPEGDELVEGTLDLVFEEDAQWVVVDYKTDQIAEAQALDQAAHHAVQLQLYGRGLAQATGQRVKERLVLFTALGRAVQV